MTEDEKDRLAEGVREGALIAAAETFEQSLKAVGVESYVIGYSSNDAKGGPISWRVKGRADMVTQMLVYLATSLPVDGLRNLIHTLQTAPMFAALRTPKAVLEGKKEWTN